MSKPYRTGDPGSTGFSMLGEVLASGYCDSAAQYQLGRVLTTSAFSVFASPGLGAAVGNDDRLVEAFILVDDGWSRVRAEWVRLRDVAESRAQQRSDSRAILKKVGTEGDPDLEMGFVSAKRALAAALSDLADAYEQSSE